MEWGGPSFFAQFVDLMGILRVPLAFFFASFIFRYLGRLRPNERRHALFMFFYFFLITSTYWLIKAIKKSLLIGQYQDTGWIVGGLHFDAAQVELIAKEGNALLALLAALIFSRLARRVKRASLALCMMALFGIGFLSFTMLLREPRPLTVWLFYFYGDLFVTLMVAAFFAFLNDSGNSRMARRLYGLIGLGGVLGGVFGSTTVAAWRISPSVASGLCVGILAIMALFARLAGKQIRLVPVPSVSPTGESHESLSWRRQFQSFVRSPYLLGIALIVGIHEMVSAVIDYQFTFTVLHFVPDEDMNAHFSNVYAFTNFISLLVQLLLTRFVLTHIGIAKALLFLPLIAFCGEAGFVLLPGLLTGSLLHTCNNAMAYSLNQAAKEALYVPIEREAKYMGKAFIDIFVLRCSKALSIAAGVILTLVFSGFSGVRGLSLIVFGLIAVWFIFIRKIDLYYKTMEVRPVRPMGRFHLLGG